MYSFPKKEHQEVFVVIIVKAGYDCLFESVHSCLNRETLGFINELDFCWTKIFTAFKNVPGHSCPVHGAMMP